jgi:hypothetical protein
MLRISGEKREVAAVSVTFILGGEARDGIGNVLKMALVVSTVCPEWKGFVEWLNDNKRDVLSDPRKVATHRTGGRVVRMSGLRHEPLGGEMLFIDIAADE